MGARCWLCITGLHILHGLYKLSTSILLLVLGNIFGYYDYWCWWSWSGDGDLFIDRVRCAGSGASGDKETANLSVWCQNKLMKGYPKLSKESPKFKLDLPKYFYRLESRTCVFFPPLVGLALWVRGRHWREARKLRISYLSDEDFGKLK